MFRKCGRVVSAKTFPPKQLRKPKMSHVPVPVCFGCGAVSEKSISCSDCGKICCASCFGLELGTFDAEALAVLPSARVCPQCTVTSTTTSAIPSAITSNGENGEAPLKVKQETCWLHEKELKLFCLSCEERICGDCFLSGGAHMRHQIDFVDTVYKEKRAETEQKLALLEDTVKDLQQDMVQSEKNLEIVQRAERSCLEEIDSVCVEAKLSVARLTTSRKRMLQIRSEIPSKKQKLNAALQEMVEQLPLEDFFKQQPLVNQQCEDMVSSCVPNSFQPTQFEDIGCDLVPPYEMQTYTLTGFDKPICGWPQHMMTACDLMWNVFLRKRDTLFVRILPYDDEVACHPYRVLVVVPHEDLRKTIQKTFLLQGDSQEEEIVAASYLATEGFVNKDSEVVVKIGIRPLNAVTENRFLKQRYRIMKEKIDGLEKRLSSSEKDINCKYYIMHFNLNLSKAPKRNQEALHSAYVLDRSDRHWCLRVYPFQASVPDANLKVFVVLRKGSRTKCRYFIELMHDDPKNNVLQCTESTFKTMDAGYGWHCFVERKRLLSDPGYYPNGILRFRFGVQPIDN